jgi:Ankyrin repeats (3 copies)
MENIYSKYSSFGFTPLQNSIMAGDIMTARELIQAKANLNIQSLGGQTALHNVCSYDNVLSCFDEFIVLKLLLENKANPLICNAENRTPFDYACTNKKRYDILKTLAYAGCWFNPTQEYRDSEEIRRLKKSKEDCRVAVVVLYGVLKRRLKQPKDTTRMICIMLYEMRFDYLIISPRLVE